MHQQQPIHPPSQQYFPPPMFLSQPGIFFHPSCRSCVVQCCHVCILPSECDWEWISSESSSLHQLAHLWGLWYQLTHRTAVDKAEDRVARLDMIQPWESNYKTVCMMVESRSRIAMSDDLKYQSGGDLILDAEVWCSFSKQNGAYISFEHAWCMNWINIKVNWPIVLQSSTFVISSSQCIARTRHTAYCWVYHICCH